MAEGKKSSEGSFTLHKEKALQKIAEFQSPYPQGWALNIAQAAVLFGCSQLQIYQASKETQFRFRAESSQSFDDFESLFFNPVSLENRAMQVLRTALWSVGVGQTHPFQISFPGERKTYIWDGQDLSVLLTEKPTHQFHVTVSHRNLSDGAGLPVLRSIQAAIYNKKLGDFLQTSLYCMPIPVYLDSLRIDGYFSSPTHGAKAYSYPLRLFGIKTAQPILANPGSDRSFDPSEQNYKLRDLGRFFQENALQYKDWSLVTLLSAHGGYYSSGKSGQWRTEPTHSVLHWVRHGVIVQREVVDLPKLGVSAALHLCADHLPTDFSGFSLNEEQAAPIRDEALVLVAEHLAREDIDFHISDQVWFHRKKALAAAAFVGGIGLKVLAGPVGVPFLFAGFIGGMNLLQGVDALCGKFDKDYQKMREDWARKFLVPE